MNTISVAPRNLGRRPSLAQWLRALFDDPPLAARLLALEPHPYGPPRPIYGVDPPAAPQGRATRAVEYGPSRSLFGLERGNQPGPNDWEVWFSFEEADGVLVH